VPARNSQSSNELFGRPELLGASKVFSRRIRPGASREDRPKRNPTSSRSGSRHHLSVHLGRGDVRHIDQVGRTYTPHKLDRQSIGVFADVWSAADAASRSVSEAVSARSSRPRQVSGTSMPSLTNEEA
jgi:hypothetical protein